MGVDLSAGMLKQARKKSRNKEIEFIRIMPVELRYFILPLNKTPQAVILIR